MSNLTIDINFVDLSVSGKSKYEPSIAREEDRTVGKFTTASGQTYHVRAEGEGHANVTFKSDSHNADQNEMFGVSGRGGADTPHIFHAVNHVIRAHVQAHPSVSVVHFTAMTDEPSRVKLYKAFASRMDPNHKHVPGKFAHSFYVNANAFRNSK